MTSAARFPVPPGVIVTAAIIDRHGALWLRRGGSLRDWLYIPPGHTNGAITATGGTEDPPADARCDAITLAGTRCNRAATRRIPVGGTVDGHYCNQHARTAELDYCCRLEQHERQQIAGHPIELDPDIPPGTVALRTSDDWTPHIRTIG